MIMTDPKASVRNRVALFDSDCLEAAGPDSLRSPSLPCFGIRPRMQPAADKLDALYAFAREHDIVMVFTHCCSARPVTRKSHPGVLVVPVDGADLSWVDKVGDYRLINI